VFSATASPDAAQGRLSWLERNVWDFGRYLARRLCTPVPDTDERSSGEKT